LTTRSSQIFSTVFQMESTHLSSGSDSFLWRPNTKTL
jgi:hypothetical protein